VNRAHLWAYCGIGLASRRSAGYQGPEHLNHNGNPALKNLLKSAAVAAINKGDHNRFQRQYEQSIAERREPALARLTVARSFATTMCTMWLTGEDYQDDYQPKPLR
jgi:transposase